jgi:hypothetical protein
MTYTALQNELTIALDDAETLARAQISYAIQYLHQAQRFSVPQIRSLLSDILSQYPDKPVPKLRVVAGTALKR